MGHIAVVFAGAVAALLFLPVLAVGGIAPPSAATIADIPPDHLALYQEAALTRCPGLPWTVLAAIARIGTTDDTMDEVGIQPGDLTVPQAVGPGVDGTGGAQRSPASGQIDADPSRERAVGPMQLSPEAWADYGLDSSGDGRADPHDPVDAAHTAAVICAPTVATTPTGCTTPSPRTTPRPVTRSRSWRSHRGTATPPAPSSCPPTRSSPWSSPTRA